MSDKVKLCHSFLFCDDPNLKSRKLDLFLICYANEPLPGGMATPFINFLFCFAKEFDSQRGYEKEGGQATAFLVSNHYYCL